MDEIINGINRMAGSYHVQDIFQDWVQMSGISISNQLFFDQQLEDQYLTLAKKYTAAQLKEMCRWTARLVELFEDDINDYLGSIYMMLNAGNSRTGQFFTPFHVCVLMARVALAGYSGGKITANEPSVGGGANILAVARVCLTLSPRILITNACGCLIYSLALRVSVRYVCKAIHC